MRVAPTITVTETDRRTLERWTRGRSTPVRLMQRAQIVLAAALGRDNQDIAEAVGVSRQLVGRWRNRYARQGLAGIVQDAPGRGRKPKVRDAVAAKIIHATTQSQPAAGTHWSTRTLARELGVSASMVSRVWRANQLKPHLSRIFKPSNDPSFMAEVTDVVGLYLNPPEHAIVLCCDEKSQIQALDRSYRQMLWTGVIRRPVF